MKKNAFGDSEPEEKTSFAKGETTAAGRMKLYKKLLPTDKVCFEAGNLALMSD
jgi:hypothetical protein